MAGRKLVVVMGRFTGKKGLQVYERLKNKVDSEWNRLQQTPAKKEKLSKLPHSEADVMEVIVVKALDEFLNELPAKELLEKEVGQTISDAQFNQCIGVDAVLSLEELRAKCRARNLPQTGSKKKLAWRLLGYGA